MKRIARWCSVLVCGLMASRANAADDVRYTKYWHHQGPNYNPNLYFPDSGSDDGDHNHERNVGKWPQTLGPEFATSCGQGKKRVACTVEHLSGGGHCESLGWARPDDPSDCGCIVHFGANVAEWDQRCRVTVTVEEQRACKKGLCLKPLGLPDWIPDPLVPVPVSSRNIWSAIGQLDLAAQAVRQTRAFGAGAGVRALVAIGSGQDPTKELAQYRRQRELRGKAQAILEGRGKLRQRFQLQPMLDTYAAFAIDLAIRLPRESIFAGEISHSCLAGRGDGGAITRYLRALASDPDPRTIVAQIHELNVLLHCMTAGQALRLNVSLARVLEKPDGSPETLRALRANLLPIVLLVIEATKAAGMTPLQREVIEHFSDYAHAWNVKSSVPVTLGLFLPRQISGDLAVVRDFCEKDKTSRCISGLALLRGITDPLAIGMGDCSLEQMIAGGVRKATGAYVCRAGVCVAAAAKLKNSKGTSLPAGLRAAIAGNATPLGIPLTAAPILSECGLGGGNGGGSAAGGTMFGSDGGNPSQAIAACVIGTRVASQPFYSCAAGGAVAGSGLAGLVAAAPAQPKVDGDTCTRGRNEGASWNDITNDEEVKKARLEVAQNLRDPTVRQDVKRVVAGVVSDDVVDQVLDELADALEKGDIPIEKMGLSDSQIAAGKTDGHTIWLNTWVTAGKGADSPQNLTNVLTHEALHLAFQRFIGDDLGDDTKARAAIEHLWMDVGGIVWSKACSNPVGCHQFDPESEACSTVSMRVSRLMSCVKDPGTPRVAAPIDPSPLDAGGSKELTACIPGTVDMSMARPCGFLDCGTEGSVLSGGRCVCGGSDEAPTAGFNVKICGAVDCGRMAIVATPDGCGCSTGDGDVSVDPSGAVVRRWGRSRWTAPVLGGLK